MGYYLMLKSEELSSHEKTWRDLKCILLSEGNQSEKSTYCMSPTAVTFEQHGFEVQGLSYKDFFQ